MPCLPSSSPKAEKRDSDLGRDGCPEILSCQRNGEQRWGESNPTQLLNSSNPGGSGIMQVACVDCVCLTRYLFASQVGSGDYSTRTQLRTASLLESTQRVWCGRARGGTRQVGLLFGRVFCELDICVIASPACSSKVHFHPLTVSWLPTQTSPNWLSNCFIHLLSTQLQQLLFRATKHCVFWPFPRLSVWLPPVCVTCDLQGVTHEPGARLSLAARRSRNFFAQSKPSRACTPLPRPIRPPIPDPRCPTLFSLSIKERRLCLGCRRNRCRCRCRCRCRRRRRHRHRLLGPRTRPSRSSHAVESRHSSA